MISTIYVFNTENIWKKSDAKLKFDHYYFLPAGFKDLFTITDFSKPITYYDFNIHALNFKKILLKDWDCSKKKLWEIYNDCKQYKTLGDYKVNVKLKKPREVFDIQWNRISTSEILYSFKNIQNMDSSFIEFDIVQNPKLENLLIDNTKNNYIWASNCFSYHYYELNFTKKQFKKFIKNARSLNLYVDCAEYVGYVKK